MCGIGGLWNYENCDLGETHFLHFIDSMAHRGPDGRGCYFDQKAHIRLGHRRLKILDLSPSGHQPMVSIDKRYVITFNGEIYNFVELRQELEQQGVQFRSSSDTEVILSAYAMWGPTCQLKFNGMWAFAIWDTQKQELFLSRDRFGVKPLLYIEKKKFFAFASEMKAFLALEGFPLEFDDTATKMTLKNPSSLEATELCLIKNVKRLPAGHCALIRRNEPSAITKWWHTLDHLQEIPSSYEEQVNQFRTLFEDSCRLRLRSDVPMGSAVSGGLDSSSVLATLSSIGKTLPERCSPDWQTAFTARFLGTDYDEGSYASEVIRHCGAKEVSINLDENALIAYFDQALFSQEDIFEVPIGPWLLYRAFRTHNRVISIDGHGADELLGGYPQQILQHFKQSLPHLPGFFSAGETLRHLSPTPISPLSFYSRLLHKKIKKLFVTPAPSIKEKWLEDPLSPNIRSQSSLLTHFDNFNHILYEDFHTRTLPVILRNFDRCSMAHGVEIRAPFLDYRLVTYAFSLPTTSKIGNGYTKKILRDAMKGILPPSIRLRRSKIGFACPMQTWLTRGLRSYVLDHVNSRTFLESPFWKGAKIRDFVETAYASSNYSSLSEVWDILIANRLMLLFKQRKTSSDISL